MAAAFGLKLDSIFAVASRYSKLAPVVEAACLIEPAIFARDGIDTCRSRGVCCVDRHVSACPAPRETRAALQALAISAHTRAETAGQLWLMGS